MQGLMPPLTLFIYKRRFSLLPNQKATSLPAPLRDPKSQPKAKSIANHKGLHGHLQNPQLVHSNSPRSISVHNPKTHPEEKNQQNPSFRKQNVLTGHS